MLIVFKFLYFEFLTVIYFLLINIRNTTKYVFFNLKKNVFKKNYTFNAWNKKKMFLFITCLFVNKVI